MLLLLFNLNYLIFFIKNIYRIKIIYRWVFDKKWNFFLKNWFVWDNGIRNEYCFSICLRIYFCYCLSIMICYYFLVENYVIVNILNKYLVN